MATIQRNVIAAVVIVGMAGVLLGCLGIHDLVPPSNDASTLDAAIVSEASSSDTGPDGTVGQETGPDGTVGQETGAEEGGAACVSGAVCSPAACQTGLFDCTGGSGQCKKTTDLTDGMPCGSGGSVCHAGSCSACSAGSDCTDMANPCVKKTIDCGSGQAVCKVAMNAPDGMPCSNGQYCYTGVCSACVVGNACSPASNPCHTGKVTSCAGGTMTCTDQNAPAPAGASCQTSSVPSGVCDGMGTCAACTPNATCTPPGKPCQQGTMTCTGGPSCGSPMNINDGKPCGTGQICSGGVCAACNATSCANGCCDSSGCVTGAQTGGNCGTKGAACASCTGGQVCTMGGGGCSCPPSAKDTCSGACTDLQTDSKNCGACGNDCSMKPHVAGPVTCSAGVCSVPPSSCALGWAHCTTAPNAGCETDVTQPANCGTCGHVCPPTAPQCSGLGVNSMCVTGCMGSTPTLCGAACVDLGSNPSNCGACGKTCPSAEICSGSNCQCASSTLVYCAGTNTCSSTQSDSKNCGTCGQACVAGKTCKSGSCACTSGQDCSNTGHCTVDPTNSCGTSCSPCPAAPANATQTCNVSTCGFACNGGFVQCGGSCINVMGNDVNNCGGCNRTCSSGQVCNSGTCMCPSGLTLCNGSCINVMGTDVNNCGGCGKTCGSGQTCMTGTCICTSDNMPACNGACPDYNTDYNNCGGCAAQGQGHDCSQCFSGQVLPSQNGGPGWCDSSCNHLNSAMCYCIGGTVCAD